MLKLTVYSSGNRPPLPTDPFVAAHWIIAELKEPIMRAASKGGYSNVEKYRQEWIGYWHIDCISFREYLSRALGKAKSHGITRIDMDLPKGFEAAHAEKGESFRRHAFGEIFGALYMKGDHEVELNLIMPGELPANSIIREVEQALTSRVS